MDLSQAANHVARLLAQLFLQEAGKSAAKELVQATIEKTKLLFQTIKNYLSRKADQKSQSLFEMFEKDPELVEEAVAKLFIRLAQTDPEFANILKSAGTDLATANIVQSLTGDGNNQVLANNNSSVHINTGGDSQKKT